ncbi:porimin [Hippopotamus amphibius kiboko]|uniref:porimin n=1 Tax=Hippopotamus amphibius kiboko TaxID=575201 RepID=UPI002599C23E|nr:porimin [Hippopotamus amphibius kiboko]
MGLGSRGVLAVLALGVVVGVALLKIVSDGTEPEESPSKKIPMSVENSSDNQQEQEQVPFSPTSVSSNHNMKLSTPASSVSKNMAAFTSKPTAKPSTTAVASHLNNRRVITLKTTAKPSTTASASNNGPAATSKPIPTSKITPEVSINMTSTTLKSTPKITNVSQNTSQITTSTVTTTHNSSVTSVSSSVTLTATIISKENKGSKFDTGSFVGGIVLTLGVLSFLYVGCKMYYSRRGIRYRTIDEHDAII